MSERTILYYKDANGDMQPALNANGELIVLATVSAEVSIPNPLPVTGPVTNAQMVAALAAPTTAAGSSADSAAPTTHATPGTAVAKTWTGTCKELLIWNLGSADMQLSIDDGTNYLITIPSGSSEPTYLSFALAGATGFKIKCTGAASQPFRWLAPGGANA